MRLISTKLAAIASLAVPTGPVLADEIPPCGLYTYSVEIVRVIDGDTVVANVDLGFDTWRHNEHLRLYAIDAPETNEPGHDEATDALAGRLAGQVVYICTVKAARSDNEKTGSFGRYLATLYVNGENINEWLLSEGYVKLFEQ